MKKVVLSFAVFFFFAGSAWADTRLMILKGEAAGEKKARLIVSVVDEAGRPIKGLAREDFDLKVAGEDIHDFTLEPVSATDSPLSLVLGIDISGSMRGRPFQETRRALSVFLDQLDRTDLVCLMSFGTEVRFLTDFTGERHEVRGQMEALRATDMWTHLYDALYEALGRARDTAPTSRTAVILLTDGRDEGSARSRENVLERAQGASVPVFTIGFGNRIDRDFLQEVAEASGGCFLFTPEPENIVNLYGTVLDHLKNQYMIEFAFPKGPGPYTAWLSMEYEGEGVEATKEFFFSPTGVPVPVPPQKPWYKETLWLIIAGVVLVIGIIVIAILLRILSAQKRIKKELAREIGNRISTEECEVEFPRDIPTPVEFLRSWSVAGGGTEEETRVGTNGPDTFLKVDCLRTGTIPLTYKGMGMLDELIIARKTREESQRKEGALYLWASNPYISTPKGAKAGHARIFLTEGERYAVEDLDSTNGTLHERNQIRGKGPSLLQDGDIIQVGGKDGIRIVYVEGSFESEQGYFEATRIVDS